MSRRVQLLLKSLDQWKSSSATVQAKLVNNQDINIAEIPSYSRANNYDVLPARHYYEAELERGCWGKGCKPQWRANLRGQEGEQAEDSASVC